MRRKQYASLTAALPTYHAINAARGLPLRGEHIGGGRHVDQPDAPTAGNHIGWTVQAVELFDGPGPTVHITLRDELLALDGTTPPGHEQINLAGHVAHDRADERPSAPGLDDAPYKRRPPVLP